MDSQETWGAADEAPTTGLPAVDDVLADLADLDRTPVSDHVAVFERAHERLRRALDAVPEG